MSASTIQLHNPFPSLIAETELFGHLAWRENLTGFILALKDHAPLEGTGEMVAWFSARNLHQVEHPAIDWFVRKASRAAIACVAESTGQSEGINISIRECWAMVNEGGQWSPPANEMASFTALAFVSGQPTPEIDNPLIHDALLALYNPVLLASKLGYPHACTFSPRDGLFLLFPGYLMRMLTPHRLSNPLVTIGINVDLCAV